ncbi:cupin domain-containing protein [Blautia sp. LMAG:36]|uniref:cupin domain-containing protein n=1 Tax=Blautia sp. LMAG:36 TaxID=1969168 RepID=UPI00257A2E19|nr:AraC family ligand binding domain-containing protein [Blautia sp. LMAG:36]
MPDIFQDSSQYFHISAFYALSLPYYHMEHHTHSSYEIMYITSRFRRVFCLDGTQDIKFPLKSGQFIFIRPDVPHRLEIPDGFPCSILNLRIFPYSRKKSGCSGASPEKGSRIFPVLEFYGSLPGLLLRRGFPQLRIQPEGSAHLFTTKFRSDTKGRISLLSSFQPHAYRACILRPLQPEHPGIVYLKKSAPLY